MQSSSSDKPFSIIVNHNFFRFVFLRVFFFMIQSQLRRGSRHFIYFVINHTSTLPRFSMIILHLFITNITRLFAILLVTVTVQSRPIGPRTRLQINLRKTPMFQCQGPSSHSIPGLAQSRAPFLVAQVLTVFIDHFQIIGFLRLHSNRLQGADFIHLDLLGGHLRVLGNQLGSSSPLELHHQFGREIVLLFCTQFLRGDIQGLGRDLKGFLDLFLVFPQQGVHCSHLLGGELHLGLPGSDFLVLGIQNGVGEALQLLQLTHQLSSH